MIFLLRVNEQFASFCKFCKPQMGFKSFFITVKNPFLKKQVVVSRQLLGLFLLSIFTTYIYCLFVFFLNEVWHSFDSNNLNCLKVVRYTSKLSQKFTTSNFSDSPLFLHSQTENSKTKVILSIHTLISWLLKTFVSYHALYIFYIRGEN